MNLLRKLFLVFMFVGFLTGAAFSFAGAWGAETANAGLVPAGIDQSNALTNPGSCMPNSDAKDEHAPFSIMAQAAS